MAIFTILYGNYYPPHGEFKLIWTGKFARRTWVNFTMEKIAKGVIKIDFTTLYGNYCHIFIENFPQKLSPCRFWYSTSLHYFVYYMPTIFFSFPLARHYLVLIYGTCFAHRSFIQQWKMKSRHILCPMLANLLSSFFNPLTFAFLFLREEL